MRSQTSETYSCICRPTIVIVVAKSVSVVRVVLCGLECAAHEFRCYLSGLCVDIARWCDGHRDCPDSSDEPSTCQHGGWSSSITETGFGVLNVKRLENLIACVHIANFHEQNIHIKVSLHTSTVKITGTYSVCSKRLNLSDIYNNFVNSILEHKIAKTSSFFNVSERL